MKKKHAQNGWVSVSGTRTKQAKQNNTGHASVPRTDRTDAGVDPTRYQALSSSPPTQRLALKLVACYLPSGDLLHHRHFLFFQVLLFPAGELAELVGRDKLGQGPASRTAHKQKRSVLDFVFGPTTLKRFRWPSG